MYQLVLHKLLIYSGNRRNPRQQSHMRDEHQNGLRLIGRLIGLHQKELLLG